MELGGGMRSDAYGTERGMSKSQLWWISVGGGACEPARLVDGAVFTIGCPDPLLTADVEMVERIDKVPLTPAAQEAERIAWERKVKRDEARGIHHGYRRFDGGGAT